MRLFGNRTGLALKLGATAAALLLGQQALAEGTRAGTPIANTASVDYFVNGIDQEDITASVTFVVDRRVSFTLAPISTPDLEPVSPGQDDAWVDFLLTNTSNSDLDFLIALAQVTTGTGVDGSGADDADMDNIEWAVVTATDLVPLQGGAQIADELAADASVRIRVWGDAAVTLTDNQIAGVELTATAKEAGAAGLGADLVYGAGNDDATIDNVDPDDADGVRISIDGFEVESADLTVAKAYSVIDDGFGGTDNPLPGATVEYTITITNGSADIPADTVVITDTLAADLTFLANQFAGADMTLNGTGCTEDAPPTDSDGCERSGQDLTFDVASIAGGASLVIVYRATINDPAVTPP